MQTNIKNEVSEISDRSFNGALLVNKLLKSKSECDALLHHHVLGATKKEMAVLIRAALAEMPDEEYRKCERTFGLSPIRTNIRLEQWCDGFGTPCRDNDYTVEEEDLPPALQYALHNVWEEHPCGCHCCVATFEGHPYVALTVYFDEQCCARPFGCSMEELWQKGVLEAAARISREKYSSRIRYVIANKAEGYENVMDDHELIVLLSPYTSKQELHRIASYLFDKRELYQIASYLDSQETDTDAAGGLAKQDAVADMFAYGYCWDGMRPVSQETAESLFKDGRCTVFLLYCDDTETEAESLEHIREHAGRGGMFGVERPANSDTPVQESKTGSDDVVYGNGTPDNSGDGYGDILTLEFHQNAQKLYISTENASGCEYSCRSRGEIPGILAEYLSEYSETD